MDTGGWFSLFDQAADLGVLQVHLSGGEPTLRRDLEQLIGGLSRRGVYTNLITAGVGIAEGRIEALAESGLDHQQPSFQGARPATTARIGNHQGSHESKLETARRARAVGLPLTINMPMPDFIELALSLDVERLEIANVQYGGWARDAFMVAPDGTVLPCHAAQTIPSLRFEQYGPRTLAEIRTDSPALNAFRGTDWMQEPCRSCERREIDWVVAAARRWRLRATPRRPTRPV